MVEVTEQRQLDGAILISRLLVMTDVILAGVLYWLFIVKKTDPREPEMDPQFLAVVLGPLGIAAVVGSFFLRQILLKRKPTAEQLKMPNPEVARRFTAVLFSEALCGAAAVLGFVLGFLTGELTYPYVLIAASIVGKIAHWPSRAWLRGEG